VTRFKSLHILTAMFIMAVLFGSASALAQGDPIATVEGNPFAIVTEEAASPVTCQDGATCIVNAPDEDKDSTPPADDDTAQDNVASFIIGIGLLAVLLFSGFALRLVSRLVPPEYAASILQEGIKMGFQMAFDHAATTKTPMDDETFAGLAKARGLDVVKDDITGRYTVRGTLASQETQKPSTPYPPTSGTPLGTDLTKSKTDTLPNRPSDGGASGGGTGFPPVR
jgi:hypothetical protein